MAVLLHAFKASYKDIRAALIALTIVSCFLYISDIPSVLLMYPLLLALAKKRSAIELGKRRTAALALALIAGMTVFSAFILNNYTQTKNTIVSSVSERNKMKRDSRSYRLMCKNIAFAMYYAKASQSLNSNAYSIQVMEDIRKNFATSDMICDLGDLYLNRADTVRAEKYYELAHYMTPGRAAAEKIVRTKYSVTGSAVLRAKKEARVFLEKKNRQI